MLQGALAVSKYATPETRGDAEDDRTQFSHYLALGAAGALIRSQVTCFRTICLQRLPTVIVRDSVYAVLQ